MFCLLFILIFMLSHKCCFLEYFLEELPTLVLTILLLVSDFIYQHTTFIVCIFMLLSLGWLWEVYVEDLPELPLPIEWEEERKLARQLFFYKVRCQIEHFLYICCTLSHFIFILYLVKMLFYSIFCSCYSNTFIWVLIIYYLVVYFKYWTS